eukprot:c27269_g1_i2 orf=529-2346(-)
MATASCSLLGASPLPPDDLRRRKCASEGDCCSVRFRICGSFDLGEAFGSSSSSHTCLSRRCVGLALLECVRSLVSHGLLAASVEQSGECGGVSWGCLDSTNGCPDACVYDGNASVARAHDRCLSGFGSGCLGLEPRKVGRVARSGLFEALAAREADLVYVSEDSGESGRTLKGGLDWLFCLSKVLAGTCKRGCDSVVSCPADLSWRRKIEICCLKRATDGLVSLSHTVVLGDSSSTIKDLVNCDEHVNQLLGVPSQFGTYQNLQRELHRDSKGLMGCFEGASRGPGRGTAKRWEVLKLAMEAALGRSILARQNAELMRRRPERFVVILVEKKHVSGIPIAGLQRSKGVAFATEDGRGAKPIGGIGNVTLQQLETSTNSANIKRETCKPPAFSLRMRDNAFAGALAGTFVSLCLHPVDTVKTVLQAQNLGHRSLFHTLVSIVSERGASGLYRGLGSNLTSSAPISAIYAYTYESVKAALISRLPKEYHALAHCAAGGCASIATSFVYTPSECVKQRMQVGSSYSNSWLAFWGILRNGGLSLLYSGWGAVVCRNVPQSVIKFYTYEGLKHLALNDRSSGSPLGTIQTPLVKCNLRLCFHCMANKTFF